MRTIYIEKQVPDKCHVEDDEYWQCDFYSTDYCNHFEMPIKDYNPCKQCLDAEIKEPIITTGYLQIDEVKDGKPKWCNLKDHSCWSLEAGKITPKCPSCEFSSYHVVKRNIADFTELDNRG